jgi:hypothetical protein
VCYLLLQNATQVAPVSWHATLMTFRWNIPAVLPRLTRTLFGPSQALLFVRIPRHK